LIVFIVFHQFLPPPLPQSKNRSRAYAYKSLLPVGDRGSGPINSDVSRVNIAAVVCISGTSVGYIDAPAASTTPLGVKIMGRGDQCII